jgi:tetratricopeptide (TPR) repeat protein
MIYRLIVIILILTFSLLAYASRDDDFRFAQKLYSDGYFDLASEQFLKFIQDYPDDFRIATAYFMRGKALLRLEKWEEARSAFLRVALEFSDSKFSAEALYNSALCLQKQSRWKESARSFLSISDYYPKSEFSAKGMVEAGVIYRSMGDDLNAIPAFERIVREYPGTASAGMAYFNLAQIAEGQGNLAEALNYYQLAGKIVGDETIIAISKIQRALLYRLKGDWSQAEAELSELKSPPQYALYADLLKAVWTQKAGDYDTAEKLFTKVRQNAKSDTLKLKTDTYIGDNYYLKEDYESALKYYQKAPPSDSIYLRLGSVYWKLNRIDQAVDAFSKVLKAEGPIANKEFAVLNLVELYSKGGTKVQISETLLDFLPNLRSTPHWDTFAMGMGRLCYEEGRYSSAKQFLTELLNAVSPLSDDALFYSGMIAEIEGDAKRAVSLYQEYMSKYPGGDSAEGAFFRAENLKSSLPAEDVMTEITRLSTASARFKTSAELSLAWGKLYFNGFRDFEKACNQLNLTLSTKDITREQTIEALELLALALKRRLSQQLQLSDSLASVMQSYLSLAAQGKSAGAFTLYLLQRQIATTPDSSRKRNTYVKGLEEMVTRFPDDAILPEVLFELEKLLCASKAETVKGIEYSLRLTEHFPQSPLCSKSAFMRGEAYLTLGDSSSAKREFENYIRKFPQGFDIFTVKVKLAELSDLSPDKIALLREILDKYYYHSQVLTLREKLGDWYFALGAYKDAVEQYTAISFIASEDFLNRAISNLDYKIASSYYQNGDWAQAESAFLQCIQRSPNAKYWEQAVKALAEIADRQNRLSDALKFYDNLATRSQNEAVIIHSWERMGEIYYVLNDFEAGRKLYLKLAESASDSAKKMDYEASAIVGIYRQGQLDDARLEAQNFEKRYRKSSLLGNYLALFFLEKGKALGKEKNFADALKSLQFLLTKYPKAPSAVEAEYEIGKIYLITNRYQEALDILTKMPGKYPGHRILSSVYITLGTYYYRQEQYQNALVSFQRVLDDTSARELWSIALNNLELTYKDLGLLEAALSVIARYLEIFPYAQDALSKRLASAQLLIQLKQYDRAIAKYQELLPQLDDKSHLEAQFYLGEANYQKGDYQQAVLEFMKVKYLDKGDTGLDWGVTSVYNAGKCYEKLGQLEEAVKLYREIIDKYGANSDYGRGAQQRIDYIENLKK